MGIGGLRWIPEHKAVFSHGGSDIKPDSVGWGTPAWAIVEFESGEIASLDHTMKWEKLSSPLW